MVLSLFAHSGNIWAFTEGSSNNYFGTGAGGTGGSNNSFFGAYAGNSNTTGNANTFLGYYAGYNNSIGVANTFLGNDAGRGNTDGAYNVLIGYRAGYSNTSGWNNTFVGNFAGYSNAGNSNIFLGQESGYSNTGDNNIFLGRSAGYSNITGTGNVFIGHTTAYSETGSNKLYIDNSSTSTPLLYGEFDNDFLEINGDLYVTGNTYMDSDENLKEDIKPIESSLNKILALKGISYEWKEGRLDSRQTSDRKHYGVIAQQVEEVLPEIVNMGQDHKKRVAYMELIPVLIEAIKEQQIIIDVQSDVNKKQQNELSELSEKVNELEMKVNSRKRVTMADNDQ
jgi:hypothetical protein